MNTYIVHLKHQKIYVFKIFKRLKMDFNIGSRKFKKVTYLHNAKNRIGLVATMPTATTYILLAKDAKRVHFLHYYRY